MTSAAIPYPGRASLLPSPAGGEMVWLALTQPGRAWAMLEAQRSWLPGIAAQCLLLSAASVIAAPAYSDLDRVISGVNADPLHPARLLGLLASVVLATCLANFLLAGVLWGGLQLCGLRHGYRTLLAYASLLLLPLALGQSLGKIIFALALPLTNSPAEVMAWHLRPFSAGLAIWLPHGPQVLSLPWALTCTFDVFGVWALALAISGLRPFLRAERVQVPWLALVLVLVCAAGAFGLWQAGQSWLAAVK